MKRYFLGMDCGGHTYIVEWDRRHDWAEWCEINEDDPRSWEVPEYARLAGGVWTFADPQVGSW